MSLFILELSSEVEHGHSLNLSLVRHATFDPSAAFEEPQQCGPFGASVNTAGVLPTLDHEPRRQFVVIVLIRCQSQLKRVYSVRKVGRPVPITFEGRIHTSRLIVSLSARIARELSPSKSIAGGTPCPAPNENVRLG